MMNVYREIFADFKQGELSQFYRLMYPELMVYANRLLGADFAFLAEDCVQNAVYKCYLRSNEMESVMQWKNYTFFNLLSQACLLASMERLRN